MQMTESACLRVRGAVGQRVGTERNGLTIVINSLRIYKHGSPAILRTAFLLTFAAATLGSLPPVALAAAPAPFSAVYNAHYDGLPLKAKAVRELRRNADGRYEFVSTASAFFARIRESSTFDWTDAGPVPRQYAYVRTGLGKNRTTDVRFDWGTGMAENVAKRKPWTVPVAPGTLDKLAVQMKLRADVKRLVENDAERTLVYNIAENGRIKRFEFELFGEETIETPMGDLRTVKLRRVRENGARRETVFWLAPAYDFLLVRMFQRERNGTRFELVIRSLEQPDEPRA